MIKILVFLVLANTAFAQGFELEAKILKPSKIQDLIGYLLPKPGSSEEKKDFEIIFQYQNTRTIQDCQVARNDMDTSLKGMFGGDHKILTDDEVKRMKHFLAKAKVSIGANIALAKNIFKRPRPYVANHNVKPCIDLESSYAFPSGHSLLMRVYANILSRVYPERAKMFMDRAHQYALSRVIGGVHHPSDIEASAVMGDYLAEKMIETEAFLENAEVK